MKTTDIDSLREAVLSRTSPDRVSHVLGVEAEAIKLARRWNVDENLTVLAALAHDVTKALDLTEQLKICEKYDIVPSIVEISNPSLLHAITGEAVCRHEFLLCDEVCSAVRWHTTGKPGMTPLEKVIFIADAIEPSRSFQGIARLRKLAYSNLDLAIYTSLTTIIIQTAQKGRLIHPSSVDARNALLLDGVASLN